MLFRSQTSGGSQPLIRSQGYRGLSLQSRAVAGPISRGSLEILLVVVIHRMSVVQGLIVQVPQRVKLSLSDLNLYSSSLVPVTVTSSILKYALFQVIIEYRQLSSSVLWLCWSRLGRELLERRCYSITSSMLCHPVHTPSRHDPAFIRSYIERAVEMSWFNFEPSSSASAFFTYV